jgi:hypothetical protein
MSRLMVESALRCVDTAAERQQLVDIPHQPSLPVRVGVWKASARLCDVVILDALGLDSPPHLEAALAAGELACPDCCGRLSPWGFARSREVRLADEVRSLRPRRAVCGGWCGATHVLLAAWAIPRRRAGDRPRRSRSRARASGTG